MGASEMPNERRGFNREAVNWPGQATLDDRQPVDIRVVDLSDSGARLLMPIDAAAHRQDLMDLAAWRSAFWPLRGKRLDVRGRVVRVVQHGDCPYAEVGVRFFSPLPQPAKKLDLQWLRNWASNMVAMPAV
jgi:hypothetical protein